MRRIRHRSPLTSLLTSKRFVVAACGAIAMVLGAMSVGASGPPNEGTAANPVFPTANRAALVAGNDSQGSDSQDEEEQATTTQPLQRPYLGHRSPLFIIGSPNNADHGVLPTARPSKPLEIKLNLTPLEVSVAVPPIPIKHAPDPESLAPLDASMSVDIPVSETPPLQGAAAVAEEVLQAIAEPESEAVQKNLEQQGL